VCSSGRHQNFLPSDQRDGSHWNGKAKEGYFSIGLWNPPQHSLSTSRRWNIQLVRCSPIAFHQVCCSLSPVTGTRLLVDNFLDEMQCYQPLFFRRRKSKLPRRDIVPPSCRLAASSTFVQLHGKSSGGSVFSLCATQSLPSGEIVCCPREKRRNGVIYRPTQLHSGEQRGAI
jgi:hypothetical protein